MGYFNDKKIISFVRTLYLSETERDLIARYNLGAYDSVEVINGKTTITRQTGYVDLGSLEWTLDTSIASYNYFTASPTWLNIQIPLSGAVVADIVTSKYTTRSWESMIGNLSDNSICLNDEAYNLIRIRDTTYNNANVFKGAMQGVILQYKLATPYTEQVIDGKPLNTLDQKGSEWLRNEWEKTLNIWNEQWELGWIDGSGNDLTTSTNIRNIGYIKVEPETTYFVSNSTTPITLRYYDNTQTFISYSGQLQNETFTTPSNCYYIRFTTPDGYTSYTNDIAIFKGDHAYPYQAYNGAIVHEKDITPVLLWENASPTNDFASGDITVSENPLNYKYIVVKFKTYKTNNEVKIQKFGSVAGTTAFNGTFYTSAKLWNVARNFTISNSTTISIDTGVYQEEGVTGTSNAVAIPIAIYGTNVL